MVSEDVMIKYRDAIALLRYRTPDVQYFCEFVQNILGEYAIKLTYFKADGDGIDGEYKNKTFKYFNTHDKAVLDFVKSVQNRVF